jgi:hypothetical protein
VAAATWILFCLGLLGAADILLYHTIAHGIRKLPDCRRELLPHALRGPTYALLFVLLPNFSLHGAWYWALVSLLAFDVAISVWDFAVERGCRARLGGLPTGEYVLHAVMAMLFGALVAVVWIATQAWPQLPTGIVYAPAAVPDMLRRLLGLMALAVLVSGLQDVWAWRRLRR